MNAPEVEELYRRYGPAVLRRARAILRDEPAAHDVLQEVFVRAIQERGSFRGEASPMTWVYRITTNLCLNRIRDEGRRQELLAAHAEGRDEALPPDAEKQATVAQLLRQVPDELREIAIYRWVDHLTQDEIAAIVKTSRRTVGNRLEEFRRLALAAAGAGEEVAS